MGANVRELGVVKVSKPCGRDWEKLAGDERTRFCTDCQLNVYDLSAMTTDEAHALIREKEGKLCVRFFTRADGTVLTRDCPVGVRRYRAKIIAAGAGAVSLSLAALAFAVGDAFTAAVSEPCSLAPIAPEEPQADEVPPYPDNGWIEKRRQQLGPHPTVARPRATMGAMMIRVPDQKDAKK